MAWVELLRALFRDRASLFQSFVQPFLLLWILAASLGGSFGSNVGESLGGNPSDAESVAITLRGFFVSFNASEFYAVVVLLVTVLVASQYATNMAVQVAGPHSAIRPRLQYRSPLKACLSLAAGILLFVTGSALFFLGASRVLHGVLWPWSNLAFWILLGALIFSSIMGGFALALTTRDQGLSDLLISLLVFLSALAAGAFFPLPGSSRIWSIAPWSPFTHVLARMLELMRRSATMPGALEYLVLICALVVSGITLRLLWRPAVQERGSQERGLRVLGLRRAQPARGERVTRTVDSRIDSRHDAANRRNSILCWAARRQSLLVCGFGIIALPLAIWLAGPAEFIPTTMPSTAGLMYPYAGLMTVLLLLFNVLLVSPIVDGPPHIRGGRAFHRWFLCSRAGVGIALIVWSFLTALALWPIPASILARTAFGLILFHFWSLALTILLAQAARDKTLFWALAVSVALLVSFLGGSLWRPTLLGWVGEVTSLTFPNGLLLHHASALAIPVVIAQIGFLLLFASP